MKIELRASCPRDLPDMERIGYLSDTDDWSDQDELLSMNKNGFGITALVGTRVVGFCCYHAWDSSYAILRLCVDPKLQRRRVATALLNDLKRRLEFGHRRRRVLEMLIDGGSLGAQLFLRFSGFTCRKFVGDNYLFRFDADRPYIHVQTIADRMRGGILT